MNPESRIFPILFGILVLLAGIYFFTLETESVQGYGEVKSNVDSEKITSVDESINFFDSSFKCINERDFKHIYSVVNATKQKLWDDWDVANFPLFLSAIDIPTRSWEIQKNKFVSMLLNSNKSKSYVVGFSGSSVTAGHDSFFNEAFPKVFEDAIRPAIEAMGMHFIVRNHALGNNPCYPYDACIKTHLGDDLDLLTWEQSMNCGRDSRPVETFVRAAARMPKQPSLVFMASGSPVWTPKDCENISTTSSRAEMHSAFAAGSKGGLDGRISTATGQGGHNVSAHLSMDPNGPLGPLTPKEKLLLTLPLKESAKQAQIMKNMMFLRTKSFALFDYYGGMAPMGQNILGLDVYKCRGPYSPDFNAKTPGGGVGWHPGRLGHKLRGENLAYFVLSILQDALDTIMPSVAGCSSKSILKSSESLTSSLTAHRGRALKDTQFDHARNLATQSRLAMDVLKGQPLIRLLEDAGAHSGEDGMEQGEDKEGWSAVRESSLGVQPAIASGDIPYRLSSSSAAPAEDAANLIVSRAEGTTVSRAASSVGGRGSDMSSHMLVLRSIVMNTFKSLRENLPASVPDPPLTCAKEDCSTEAMCFTDFEPRVTNSLSGQVVGLHSVVNAAPVDNAAPSTPLHDLRSSSMSQLRLNISSKYLFGNWSLELSFFDRSAVQKAADRGLGYVDRKYIFLSHSEGDAISFFVKVTRHNSLWLCEVQKGFLKYPPTMGDLDKAAALFIHKNVPEDVARRGNKSFSPSLGEELLLVLAADQCYRTPPVPKGSHVLTLVQKGEQQINLAYLLSW